MAEALFSKLPINNVPTIAGPYVAVAVDCQGGILSATIRCPLGPGGELILKRIAVSSVTPGWEHAKNKTDDWPTVRLVLDKTNNWCITYDLKRIVVDSWSVRPNAKGDGYEEVLVIRSDLAIRKRKGQNAVQFSSN